MKSPFTGGEATLMREAKEFKYRNEMFWIINHYYVCVDSGEVFSTTDLDNLNLNQVFNQYRVKYWIPFTDEIISTREKYGLSAKKMSEILGFGDNQYRLYESGEMPSESNGKIISSIKDTDTFSRLVDMSVNQLTNTELSKIREKIGKLKLPDTEDAIRKFRFFGNNKRSQDNGFTEQSIDKVVNMALYFIEKFNCVYVTQLNKLMFYSDFLNYKQYGVGISGLSYRAIQHGPVPSNYGTLYESIDHITKEINGEDRETLTSANKHDAAIFSQNELEVLSTIYEKFKDINTTKLSDKSHQEDAWIQNKDGKKIIDYGYAFSLKSV